jgi:hypothetical protein
MAPGPRSDPERPAALLSRSVPGHCRQLESCPSADETVRPPRSRHSSSVELLLTALAEQQTRRAQTSVPSGVRVQIPGAVSIHRRIAQQ